MFDYSELRDDISDKPNNEALELKKSCKGVISCTTRGQLGVSLFAVCLNGGIITLPLF